MADADSALSLGARLFRQGKYAAAAERFGEALATRPEAVEHLDLPMNVSVFRALRLLRVLKLLRSWQEMMLMVQTIANSALDGFWLFLVSKGICVRVAV